MVEELWTWRQRARDPRYAGLLALAIGAAGAFALLHRDTLAAALTGAVVAVAAAAVIGLLVLPRWRDPRRTARTGGLILGGAGVLVLGVALVAAFGFGVAW